MTAFSRYFIFFSILIFFQCEKETLPEVQTPGAIEQSFPITYKAQIPEGKLPLPHHNPDISQSEADMLTNRLFIINNFGQYQCGDEKGSCYFHSGLDMILPNGTPIFAIDSGIVRANIGGDQFYRSLIIEDMNNPGYGWSYTHVYHFVVSPGDHISQGQYLGQVNFNGLDHIHLSRVKLLENGSWDRYSEHVEIYPDDYFIFIDTAPPIIEKPFLFYKNVSDVQIDNGDIDTISGAVDIVVKMRDQGEYAGDWIDGDGPYWGDRLCVKRIHYRILKDGKELVNRPSFDFSKLHVRYNDNRWRQVMTVFKHHLVVYPDYGPTSSNMYAAPYIITNVNETEGEIDLTDDLLAWETDAVQNDGAPVFPDGLYEIEVTAWDSNENQSTVSDFVFVRNE